MRMATAASTASTCSSDPPAARRDRTVSPRAPPQPPRLHQQFSLGAQINWEIDLWGRLTDETRAAYKDAGASLAEFEGARLSIAGAVSQSWFGLIEARQQRELAQRDTTRARAICASPSAAMSAASHPASMCAFRARRSARARRTSPSVSARKKKRRGALKSCSAAILRLSLKRQRNCLRLLQLAGAGAPGDILARRPDLIAAEARMEANGLRARAASNRSCRA